MGIQKKLATIMKIEDLKRVDVVIELEMTATPKTPLPTKPPTAPPTAAPATSRRLLGVLAVNGQDEGSREAASGASEDAAMIDLGVVGSGDTIVLATIFDDRSDQMCEICRQHSVATVLAELKKRVALLTNDAVE